VKSTTFGTVPRQRANAACAGRRNVAGAAEIVGPVWDRRGRTSRATVVQSADQFDLSAQTRRCGSAGRVREPAPRFSWTYGTNPQIGGFDGAPAWLARPDQRRYWRIPKPSNSQLIAGAAIRRSSQQRKQLSCIGSAVPIPNWATISAAPATFLRPAQAALARCRALCERCALHAGLHPAAQLACELELEPAGPQTNRFRLSNGVHVFIELESAEPGRLEFQIGNRSLHSVVKSPVYVNQTSIVSDDRRNHLARRTCHAELCAGHRLLVGSQVAHDTAVVRSRAGRV